MIKEQRKIKGHPIVGIQTFRKYPRKLKRRIKYLTMTREESMKHNILCVYGITHRRLPNGRCIYYHKPRVMLIKTKKQLHGLSKKKKPIKCDMSILNKNHFECYCFKNVLK